MNWTIAIAAYCILGVMILSIIPSSRKEVMATIHDKDLARAPRWKVILFWVMMSAAVFCFRRKRRFED
jgi:ABC-type Fe3+ transport system permease subunit